MNVKMDNGSTIQLYHFEPSVNVLGPGTRSVVWLQGCAFHCKGCIVPDSHLLQDGQTIPIFKLVQEIASQSTIEGITLSGGEPFMQKDAMLSLITGIKKKNVLLH